MIKKFCMEFKDLLWQINAECPAVITLLDPFPPSTQRIFVYGIDYEISNKLIK